MQSEFAQHVQQAQAALGQRDFGRARKHIRWLLRKEANHLDSQILQGVYHRERKELKQALKVFTAAAQMHPGHSLPYLNRSKVHLLMQNTDQAIEDMATACQLAPQDSGLLNRYVDLLISNRRYGDAIDPLSRLLGFDPQSATVAYNLGRCLLEIGRFAQARPLLMAVYEAAPRDPGVACDYAVLLEKLGQSDEALACVLPLANEVEHRALKLQTAWLLEDTGQLDDAAALLASVLKQTPDDLDVLARRARVAAKQEDKSGQTEMLLSLVSAAQKRQHPSWSSFEMWALLELGQYKEAFDIQSDHFNVLPWEKLIDLAQNSDRETERSVFSKTSYDKGLPVILAAGDSSYYERFGGRLIGSVLQNAPEWQVHLHIILEPDQSPPVFSHDRVSLSYETKLNATKTYLACRRFTLLPTVLETYRQPVVCVDMDTLVNQPPTMVFAGASSTDAFVYLRADTYGFSQMVAAGFTAVRPTQGGSQFATFVACYCDHFLGTGDDKWFLDQMALGAAYVVSKRDDTLFEVGSAPAHALDFDKFAPNSLVWAAKGSLELPELT